MNGYRGDDDEVESRPLKPRSEALWLLGIVPFLIVTFALQDYVGIPFDVTYRVFCASACLVFIYKLRSDFPGQQWPRTSLWIALLINVAIFFTPLVDRPTSRGELMLFALPDAVVVLTASTISYGVNDVHQRATRQTMILGLIVALVFCVGLFAITLGQVHAAHLTSGSR
jgi:Na+-translocating ferredoxin:NAD+ oxidoreductase RnfA subunit